MILMFCFVSSFARVSEHFGKPSIGFVLNSGQIYSHSAIQATTVVIVLKIIGY